MEIGKGLCQIKPAQESALKSNHHTSFGPDGNDVSSRCGWNQQPESW